MRKVYIYVILMAALLCGVQTIKAASGLFSVGDSKYVQLAGGNLQKNGETWSFADHQWTVLGNANVSNNARADYHDLFQWDEISGTITISGQDWRALTGEEWYYLFDERTNHDQLYASGKVNGVQGLIILPDGWVLPKDLTFIPGYNSSGTDFEQNVYDASQWESMETNGAAFLPCGGYGYMDEDEDNAFKVSNLTGEEAQGNYWSSTALIEDKAYSTYFSKDQLYYYNDASSKLKSYYFSVRLAQDRTITLLSEDDEPNEFNTKFSTASSESYAIVKRTLYQDGFFNTICLPFTVTIANSPLDGCELYAFNGATVVGDVLQVDIEQVTTGQLTAGVPYLIRWSNTGEIITYLLFESVTWGTGDDASSSGAIDQSSGVVFHGFYGKNHITDNTTGEGENKTHYNFFLGANNTLYWPTDGGNAESKMKGFRAHFYIKPNGSQSNSPLRRGMPAVLRIVDTKDTATGIEEPSSSSLQGGDRGRLILRDGQILILRNEHIYDITGKEVTL